MSFRLTSIRGEKMDLYFYTQQKLLRAEWQPVASVSLEEYKQVLRFIAHSMQKNRPNILLVDMKKLRCEINHDLRQWWTEHILPVYQSVGLQFFAHITNNSNPVGEYDSELPFRMAEFNNFDKAWEWSTSD